MGRGCWRRRPRWGRRGWACPFQPGVPATPADHVFYLENLETQVQVQIAAPALSANLCIRQRLQERQGHFPAGMSKGIGGAYLFFPPPLSWLSWRSALTEPLERICCVALISRAWETSRNKGGKIKFSVPWSQSLFPSRSLSFVYFYPWGLWGFLLKFKLFCCLFA